MLGWVGKAALTLGEMFPLELAEPWDNVGILVDSTFSDEEIGGTGVILFTNDLTEKVLEEAMSAGAKLVVTYHPRPFGSFKRLKSSDVTQRIVLRCARAGICVYSPHTCCDNAAGGVNDWLAQAFSSDPSSISPVKPIKIEGYPGAGSGRIVQLPEQISLRDAVEIVKKRCSLQHVRLASAQGMSMEDIKIKSVAVQAGSGGSVLLGCTADLLVMGEMSHHDTLAAIASGSSVILTEHSNSERGFLPHMVEELKKRMTAAGYDKIQYIISQTDADPLSVV